MPKLTTVTENVNRLNCPCYFTLLFCFCFFLCTTSVHSILWVHFFKLESQNLNTTISWIDVLIDAYFYAKAVSCYAFIQNGALRKKGISVLLAARNYCYYCWLIAHTLRTGDVTTKDMPRTSLLITQHILETLKCWQYDLVEWLIFCCSIYWILYNHCHCFKFYVRVCVANTCKCGCSLSYWISCNYM